MRKEIHRKKQGRKPFTGEETPMGRIRQLIGNMEELHQWQGCILRELSRQIKEKPRSP